MSRKSFVLYTEWENTFNRLSNELAGELIKVIFDYVRTGEIPQIDNAVVDGVFSAFQPSIAVSYTHLTLPRANEMQRPLKVVYGRQL